MDLELADRVVVVTGASSGIGRAVALTLASEGARLAIGAREPSRLEAVAEELRERETRVVAVAGDLTANSVVDRLARDAVDEFGTIHGLVCCVGSTPLGDFDELTDEIWEQAFEMKFLATIRAIRASLPAMREQLDGRIVVVGGNSAHDPTPWMLTSGAINSALGNLVSSLGRTYGREGIGVNCVSPGPVRTPRLEGLRAAVTARDSLDRAAAEERITSRIPNNRIAEPNEVAAQVAYLLSPLSRHVNGASLVIDGGQTWAR